MKSRILILSFFLVLVSGAVLAQSIDSTGINNPSVSSGGAGSGTVTSISPGSSNIVINPNPLTTTGTIDIGTTVSISGSMTAASFNASTGNTGYQLNGVNGISYPSADSTANQTIIIGAGAVCTGSSASYANVCLGYNINTGATIGATGIDNVFIGSGLGGSSTTTAHNNVIIGEGSATGISTANGDVVIGQAAATALATGANNVFIGASTTALAGATTSVAIGEGAGTVNSGSGAGATSVIAIGFSSKGTGQSVSVGSNAGTSASASTTGNNAFIGFDAGQFTSSSTNNTFIGALAGTGITGTKLATTSGGNTGIGEDSLNLLQGTTTNNNTAVGVATGSLVTTGSNNTIIGASVGSTVLATGSNNLLLGTSSNTTTSGAAVTNEIHIGAGGGDILVTTGAGTNTTASTTAHGIWNMPDLASSSAGTTGTVCWTTSTGLLNVDTTVACLASLEELKDIKPGGIQNALNIVNKLNPFWYTWKKNTPEYKGDKAEQPGLGAHQVEGVDKRLVGYASNGSLKGVRYAQMVALLVQALKEEDYKNHLLEERVKKLESHK